LKRQARYGQQGHRQESQKRIRHESLLAQDADDQD
jgi:hypothetical protein